MYQIREITVLYGNGEYDQFTVGESLIMRTKKGETVKKKIGSIEARSVEFENKFHSLYEIIGEQEVVLKDIENCPVIVEYFVSEKLI